MYYLMRKYPAYICRLQNEAIGGPPDQIFYSINVSWQNGLKVLTDNKELIPEFYVESCISSVLLNEDECELGTDHLGERVNDVELPPWASTPRDFTLKLNYVLEQSDIS